MNTLYKIFDWGRKKIEVYSSEKVTRDIMRRVEKQCKLQHLTPQQQIAVQNYWKPLVGKRVDTRMHEIMLSLTGEFKPEFEPFEVCYEVQTKSYKRYAMNFFDDKNLYRQLLGENAIPERICECINGCYYLRDNESNKWYSQIGVNEVATTLSNIEDCIIKPSTGSCGGVGVKGFQTKNGVDTSSGKNVKEILIQYGTDFCIERKIHECENLQRLNETSCNTLRIHTFRNRESQKINYVSSFIRIGRKGMVVDNGNFGGLCARIFDEDSSLHGSVQLNPYMRVFETDCGISLKGYRIENHRDMIDVAIHAHERLPMFDYVGWDMAVDRDGKVVIIEFNPNPDNRLDQLIFDDTCLLKNQEWIVKQTYNNNK
jgi:hypothetical protein